MRDTIKKVDVFFNENITTTEFALYMRKLLHANIMLSLQADDNTHNSDIKSGYYWLTQFIEQIDPMLEK